MADHTNQLVQLELHGFRVPILGVLNQENHQERYDRRPGVDYQLPSIGVVEYRAGERPNDYDEYTQHKGARRAASVGRPAGEFTKQFPHAY
jgi:hypothetical protein